MRYVHGAILALCLLYVSGCTVAYDILDLEMVSVTSGTFPMGGGKGSTYISDGFRLPAYQHDVTLSAYQIGKFEVTNAQYCEYLNWAKALGFLKGADGVAYYGGDVYFKGQALLIIHKRERYISYNPRARVFTVTTGESAYGAPLSMANHPVVGVTWYGAVAFCNWRSKMEGLVCAYDRRTWDLVDTDTATSGIQFTNGYRLPTEAEWERAAAWDGSKHWSYGFPVYARERYDQHFGMRANMGEGSNPVALVSYPRTSPVGWFNGKNPSRRERDFVTVTIDSRSPVLAYDLSGNVQEWCHDWYDAITTAPQTNPTGPAIGQDSVLRGGSWQEGRRSYERNHANRELRMRDDTHRRVAAGHTGFRVARTLPPWLGAVEVDVTPNAGSWTLVGPPGFKAVSGSGDRLVAGGDAFTNAPLGVYTLTCGGRVDGYHRPPPVTGNLTTSDALTLTAVYPADNPETRIIMQPVSPVTFTMGRPSDDDNALADRTDEIPRREVTLSAYEIGRFEVTNAQLCEVLQWAHKHRLLKHKSGALYGTSWMQMDVYHNEKLLIQADRSDLGTSHQGQSGVDFSYADHVFSVKTPASNDGTTYSLATHPVTYISWYGAVAFCNWRSMMEGLTPAYDLTSWELVDADAAKTGAQFTDGYRLPTEAEWERAAAWDGAKHWTYGCLSDALTTGAQCNSDDVNPLGLISMNHTSPVGWFNGVNVSPNGNVSTVDAASPVGSYDMSGNVHEWCHDWYDIYTNTPQSDPTGPASGTKRVARGGSWRSSVLYCRSARRGATAPEATSGFRVVRTMPAP